MFNRIDLVYAYFKWFHIRCVFKYKCTNVVVYSVNLNRTMCLEHLWQKFKAPHLCEEK